MRHFVSMVKNAPKDSCDSHAAEQPLIICHDSESAPLVVELSIDAEFFARKLVLLLHPALQPVKCDDLKVVHAYEKAIASQLSNIDPIVLFARLVVSSLLLDWYLIRTAMRKPPMFRQR